MNTLKGGIAVGLTLLCGAAGAQSSPGNFERLTLKESIRRALQRNPRMEVQLNEERRAKAVEEQVRSSSMPTLMGNGQYTRFDDVNRDYVAHLTQNQNQVWLSATAQLPVFAPQRWVAALQAHESSAITRLGTGDVKRQIAMVVANTYLEILVHRRDLELNVHARDTAKAHFTFTHTRLLAGRGSRIDDVRAQQEVEQDEAAVATAELALLRAQEMLGVLVGVEVPIDAAEEPTVEMPSPAAEDIPRLRADLIQLKAREHLAHRTLRNSWADYMPTLSIGFTPTFSYPAQPADKSAGTPALPALAWVAQAFVTVPFYDGGLRYGLTKERRALFFEATANLEGALRQMRSDVRLDNEATRQTSRALTNARNAAQLAHDAFKIADLSYRAGASTNIELIDAERRARDADTAAAIAENAARQSRIDLLFATGQLP